MRQVTSELYIHGESVGISIADESEFAMTAWDYQTDDYDAARAEARRMGHELSEDVGPSNFVAMYVLLARDNGDILTHVITTA